MGMRGIEWDFKMVTWQKNNHREICWDGCMPSKIMAIWRGTADFMLGWVGFPGVQFITDDSTEWLSKAEQNMGHFQANLRQLMLGIFWDMGYPLEN